MDILITKSTRSAQFSSIEMSDGKRSVYIGRGASGQITICALNASHRALDWSDGYEAERLAALTALSALSADSFHDLFR